MCRQPDQRVMKKERAALPTYGEGGVFFVRNKITTMAKLMRGPVEKMIKEMVVAVRDMGACESLRRMAGVFLSASCI